MDYNRYICELADKFGVNDRELYEFLRFDALKFRNLSMRDEVDRVHDVLDARSKCIPNYEKIRLDKAIFPFEVITAFAQKIEQSFFDGLQNGEKYSARWWFDYMYNNLRQYGWVFPNSFNGEDISALSMWDQMTKIVNFFMDEELSLH